MMRRANSGVTFIEMMVAVILMAVLIMLAVFGSRFVGLLFRESSSMKVQQEVQVNQYNIVNDIRNAADIIHISSDTLQLSVLDLRKNDFDTLSNPFLFKTLSRLTFRFRTVDNVTYLERQLVPPTGPTLTTKLLMNVLLPPVETDPSTFIFAPVGTTTAPYQYVRVKFRIVGGFFRTAPKTYAVEAGRRSRL